MRETYLKTLERSINARSFPQKKSKLDGFIDALLCTGVGFILWGFIIFMATK